MATLSEIESAIEQLSPGERAKLARWWQTNFDPDEGLELRDEVERELDAAQQEIARGDLIRCSQEPGFPVDGPSSARSLSLSLSVSGDFGRSESHHAKQFVQAVWAKPKEP